MKRTRGLILHVATAIERSISRDYTGIRIRKQQFEKFALTNAIKHRTTLMLHNEKEKATFSNCVNINFFLIAAYLAYHKDPRSFIPVVGRKGKERSLRTCLNGL